MCKTSKNAFVLKHASKCKDHVCVQGHLTEPCFEKYEAHSLARRSAKTGARGSWGCWSTYHPPLYCFGKRESKPFSSGRILGLYMEFILITGSSNQPGLLASVPQPKTQPQPSQPLPQSQPKQPQAPPTPQQTPPTPAQALPTPAQATPQHQQQLFLKQQQQPQPQQQQPPPSSQQPAGTFYQQQQQQQQAQQAQQVSCSQSSFAWHI